MPCVYNEVDPDVPTLTTEITPEIEHARQQLAAEFDNRLADIDVLDSTLKLALSAARRQQLTQLRNALDAEVQSLYQTGLLCFSDLANCPQEAEQMLAGLRAYDRKVVKPNPFTDGLVAYYPFDGDTSDITDNNNNLSGGESLIYTDGMVGPRGAYFDNHTELTTARNIVPTGAKSKTIVAWAKMLSGQDTNHDRYIAGSGTYSGPNTNFMLGYGIGSAFDYGIWLFDCNYDMYCYGGTPNTVDKEFHHLVVTYDESSSILSLFQDGQLKSSKSIVLATTAVPFYISFSRSFHGIIDDVRLYDRTLTDTEIQQLYTATTTTINQPPLAIFQTTAAQGTTPLTFTVDAGLSADADGIIVNYTWEITEMVYEQPVLRETANGQIATFTLDSEGEYTVSLLVEDDQGATSIAQRTIFVDGVGEGPNPEEQKTLTVQVNGSGSVSATGITCGVTGTDCDETYAQGTQATLTASPDKDYEFTGWSGGGCSGTGNCVVDMSADTDVTATFEQVPVDTCRLINISTRANVSGGANDAFAGFVLEGTGTQQVMLRGIGAANGVDPVLTLLKRNGAAWEQLGSNDEWELDPNADGVRVLPPNLHLPDAYGNDAGMLLNLEAGVYTAQLGSNGGPGLEVIGVDAINQFGPTLTNISTRAYVSGGANDAFAGFVVSGGNCTVQVMLRGIAVDSGVNPLLTLLKRNGTQWDMLESNDEWDLHANAADVGALPVNLKLPDTYGNDAGMLLNLEPGVYSVQLGSSGSPGLAVVGVDIIK